MKYIGEINFHIMPLITTNIDDLEEKYKNSGDYDNLIFSENYFYQEILYKNKILKFTFMVFGKPS